MSSRSEEYAVLCTTWVVQIRWPSMHRSARAPMFTMNDVCRASEITEARFGSARKIEVLRGNMRK